MKKTMLLAAAMLSLAAAPAAGQTISQGMTAEQVRAAFGAPATTRESGDWAYWYYHNGCPRTCGSDDVVFFRDGRVVAAVLRTSARRFSGPDANDALESAGGQEQSGTVRVGGVRVEGQAAETPGQLYIVRDRDEPEEAEEEADPDAPVEERGPSIIVVGTPDEDDEAAADTTGEPEEATSVDRAHDRNVQDRSNEETATQRARRHDRPRRP